MTMIERPEKRVNIIRDVVEDRLCLRFSPKDKISEIIQRMQRQNCVAAGVVNNKGKFLGMITEREIVRRAFGTATNIEERLDIISKRPSSADLTAWDIMIADPNKLDPEDSIETAVDLIDYYGYRFMPVVDKSGEFLGIADERELHKFAKIKTQRLLQVKDSLLAYTMGSEPYGRGAII
jgi:CBS domain-containing protein